MATRRPPKSPTDDAGGIAAVTELPEPAPTLREILDDNKSLFHVLNAAVDEMSWLKATDAAMVKLAQQQAQCVDDAVAIAAELDDMAAPLHELAREGVDITSIVKRIRAIEAQAEVIKVIGWVGPHLANALRDLGGAPGQRKGLEADAPVKSKLAQLRDSSSTRTKRAASTAE